MLPADFVCMAMGSVAIIAAGWAVLYRVNKPRPIRSRAVNSASIGRTDSPSRERGDPTTRWITYSTIGGAFVGFHLTCGAALLTGANRIGFVAPIALWWGPVGVLGGGTVGFFLGAVSRLLLNLSARPPDPDAG